MDHAALVMIAALNAGVLVLTAAVVALVLRRARRSAKVLSAVIDAVPAALAKFDANTRLVLWNQHYAEFVQRFGVNAEVGLTREQIIRSTVGDAVYEAVARAGSRNPGWAGKGASLEWPTRDGGWLRADIRGLGRGASLTLLSDITDEKQAKTELVQERDREKAANLAKSEFLANMSHEIRTPLNGVMGMVQVMERDDLSARQRERLGVIKDSGATLLTVLNDILDISKIEAGKLEIAPVVFDLVKLGRECVKVFEAAAAGKDLHLAYRPGDTAVGFWRGDALRIRQIISNLIANAVKFTDAGEVGLEISGGDGAVTFQVVDSGIGIGPDKIERLFDKFVQADETTTRRYGGTGLGLAICRDLAELMGGRVEVESQPGRGSIFRLTLPLDRVADGEGAAEDAAAEAPQTAPARLRILAAEDNATNQLVLSSLLDALGAEVTLAADGQQAVEAFERAGFDVVLMDMQMPVMNGVDATRAIRRIEAERGLSATPIIALTANVMQHQVESYLEAGMNGTLAKPIELEKLYLALESAMSARENTVAADPSERNPHQAA